MTVEKKKSDHFIGSVAAVLLLLFLLSGCSSHRITEEEYKALAVERVEDLIDRTAEETSGYEKLLSKISYHDHRVVSSSRDEMTLEVTVNFPDFIELYESFYRDAIDQRLWEAEDPAGKLREEWNRSIIEAQTTTVTLPEHFQLQKEDDTWKPVEGKERKISLNLPAILLDPLTRDLRAWKRDYLETYFQSKSDHTKPVFTELGERIFALSLDFDVEFERTEEENKEELKVHLYRLDPDRDALKEALAHQLAEYKEGFIPKDAIAGDLSELFLSLEKEPRLLSTTVISIRDPFYYLSYREDDEQKDEADEGKIDLDDVYDIARHGFISVSEGVISENPGGGLSENPEVSFGDVYDVRIWQDVIVVLHGILDDEREYFFFTPETINLSFFHRESLELLENIEFDTYRHTHMERRLQLELAGDYLILDQEKRESYFNLPLSIYEMGHDDEEFALRLIQGGEEITFEFVGDNGESDRAASYSKPYKVLPYKGKPYVMMEVREESLWKFVLYDPVENQRMMEITEEDFDDLAVDEELAPRPVATFIEEEGQLIFTLKYPTGEEKEDHEGYTLGMLLYSMETGEMTKELTRPSRGSGWIHAVAPFGAGKSIGVSGKEVFLIDYAKGSGTPIPLEAPMEVYLMDVTPISEDLVIFHHCLRGNGKGVGPNTQHLWKFDGESLRYVKELEQGHYAVERNISTVNDLQHVTIHKNSYQRITSPWTILGIYEELTIEELLSKPPFSQSEPFLSTNRFQFELKELLDEGLVYPISAAYPMASLTNYGHGIFLADDPNEHHLYPLGGISYVLPYSGEDHGELRTKIYHLEQVKGVSVDHDSGEIFLFTEKGLYIQSIEFFLDHFLFD